MTFSCEKVGVEFFDTAPTRYQASQEIAATPEQVFEVLLDADSWVAWAMPITAVEWTSGFPIDVGSTRSVHMRGGLIGYEEFIAYEHGVRMAFRFNEASKDGITGLRRGLPGHRPRRWPVPRRVDDGDEDGPG